MTQIHNDFQLDDPARWREIADALARVGTLSTDAPTRIESLFFDTFDGRLHAARLCLRQSRTGRKHVLELEDFSPSGRTLSAPTTFDGGFIDDVPTDALRRRLGPVIDMRRLMPMVGLTGQRRLIALRDKEGKTVLRLRLEDQSGHRPGTADKVKLGTRLTLMPVRGYDKALKKVTQILTRATGVEPANNPILDAAMMALGMPMERATAKSHLALTPGMTAGQASRFIHKSLINTMIENEEGVCRDLDSEFLHDFRVAVRRTRSALGQIDKGVLPPDHVAKAKADFKWLGNQTGHKRDLDVYLLAFPDLRKLLPESYAPHLQPFHDFLAEQGAKEARKLARVIRGRRYRLIRDDWQAWLSSSEPAMEDGPWALAPIKELADQRIWKAYRRLMRDGQAITDDSPPEALHDLRIIAKKLRYLLEFFHNLYASDRMTRLIKALKALQTVLGDFQDAEVQSQAILHFGREMAEAGRAPVETHMAMGMVAESILTRQAQARDDFARRFADFAKPDVAALCADMFKARQPE